MDSIKSTPKLVKFLGIQIFRVWREDNSSADSHPNTLAIVVNKLVNDLPKGHSENKNFKTNTELCF